jgi:hypothetical protein
MKTATPTIEEYTEFISHQGFNQDLADAVIANMGIDDVGEAKQVLGDVCRGGAAAGWTGFTYYSDTVSFFNENKVAICELAENMADNIGHSLIDMVASFNMLDATEKEIAMTLYGKEDDADKYVANSLAWFALEELAHAADAAGEFDPES